MELMTLEEKCLKPYSDVKVIDFQVLARAIQSNPEDYIFLLATDEWSKYLELNEQICLGLKGEPMDIDEQTYITQYQGVFTIATVAIQPDFAKRYKTACLSYPLLGDTHILFFVDRTGRDMQRAKEVLTYVLDFKETVRKDSSKN